MAFVDTLLSEFDAQVVIVDRNHLELSRERPATRFVQLPTNSRWRPITMKRTAALACLTFAAFIATASFAQDKPLFVYVFAHPNRRQRLPQTRQDRRRAGR
jgi:hypothetical protein